MATALDSIGNVLDIRAQPYSTITKEQSTSFPLSYFGLKSLPAPVDRIANSAWILVVKVKLNSIKERRCQKTLNMSDRQAYIFVSGTTLLGPDKWKNNLGEKYVLKV